MDYTQVPKPTPGLFCCGRPRTRGSAPLVPEAHASTITQPARLPGALDRPLDLSPTHPTARRLRSLLTVPRLQPDVPRAFAPVQLRPRRPLPRPRLLDPVIISSDSDAGWDYTPASEDPPVFFAEAEVERRTSSTPNRVQSGFTTDDPSYEEVDVVGGVDPLSLSP